jgi:hypothetical protein
VTLELGIVQNPGQTAPLSLMPLQDCQKKNNYVTHNYKLQHNIYHFIIFNNFSFPDVHECINTNQEMILWYIIQH